MLGRKLKDAPKRAKTKPRKPANPKPAKGRKAPDVDLVRVYMNRRVRCYGKDRRQIRQIRVGLLEELFPVIGPRLLSTATILEQRKFDGWKEVDFARLVEMLERRKRRPIRKRKREA